MQTDPLQSDEQGMLDSAHVSLLCSLLTAACFRPEIASRSAEVEPCPLWTFAGERRVALESQPSPEAASLLPSGAHYRLVATDEEIALVVVAADNRISGRLRIQPLDRSDDGCGSTIVIDDFDGPEVTIDTWSSAGRLHGEVAVGERRAAWKVRVDADGSLAGEEWSMRHGSRSDEADVLRRARAIGADIGRLTAELARSGVWSPESERELTELAMLAAVALDLSVRAWEGRGRSSLPHIGE